jgi:hypothetical protein
MQTNQYLTAQGDAHLIRWDHQSVRLAPFDATNPRRQLWYLEDVPGQQFRYFIWNALSGRVLTIDTTTGMATTHPRVAGAQSNQVWWIRGVRALESAHGCLDVYYANYAYGPNVGTWSCHGQPNQDWHLQVAQ